MFSCAGCGCAGHSAGGWKRELAAGVGLFVVIAAAGLWLAASVSLSALEEPGEGERYAATKAKRWLIGRAARNVPAAPRFDDAALAMGGMQFRADCAACHGSDGRTPTEIGRSMSPRAPDLGAPETQAWSDAELFWIIQHGIKLTGMPGFGRQHDDERIWHLVAYIRQMGKPEARPAP